MKDQSALDMTLEFFGTFLERKQNIEACQAKLQTAIDNIAQPDRVDEADNRNMIKSCDDLPMFMDAEDVYRTLGISRANAYKLMHSEDFPTISLGKRMIVAKDAFILWKTRASNTKFQNTPNY